MGRLARSEPERTVQKVRLENRLDHQFHSHLNNTISNRGNPQGSFSPVRFRNVDTLDWQRLVAFGTKFFVQLVEESCHARTINDVLTRHPIHAGRTLVLQYQLPCCCQHVAPIDPVVQYVKPKLRLLFGLATQLPPQCRDFYSQSHPCYRLRWNRRRSGLRQLAVRCGILIQAVLLTSCENMFTAEALRSTGITRRQHYYGPLRLPTRPASGYVFPLAVETTTHPADDSPHRVSQVPCVSFDARCPQSPRVAHLLQIPVASQVVRGFALFGRLAATIWCHEAESGSLALRLTSSPQQDSTAPVTRIRCPPSYTVNRKLP